MYKCTINKITKISLFFFVFVFSGFVFAQRSKAYDDYIKIHKELAISHMMTYKIPASVTLAQGLLESGAGKSRLATQANNHFGIKCHKEWKGPSIAVTDDAPNECFRKYESVVDSYADHSKFLQRSRYSALFDLEITDYKGWAKGLQEAGYATDKAYANKLIKLIEDYQLYQYDDPKYALSASKEAKNTASVVKDKKPERVFTYEIYKTSSGLLYVEAKAGDTYNSVANALGFKGKDLIKYNDVPTANFPLNKGDIVYLEKKKKKTEVPLYYHIVVPGESMHSISQLYGVQLKNLYKINKKKGDYIPEDGDQLSLR